MTMGLLFVIGGMKESLLFGSWTRTTAEKPLDVLSK
jgi:hypothetical protein